MLDLHHYNEHRGVYSPLMYYNGVVYGFWLCGQNYRTTSDLYGAYPATYIRRIGLLFPKEFREGLNLHLFSGAIRSEGQFLTYDIRPDYDPDVCQDATELDKWCPHDYFDLILADPPYGKNHEKYGTQPFSKAKVVRAASKVVKPGGYLVWLDTIIPMWAKKDGWRLAGTIGIVQSTNHQVRVVTILERVS